MKSKRFILVSLVALASLVLSACGGAGGGGNMKTEIGEGEGEHRLRGHHEEVTHVASPVSFSNTVRETPR